MKCLIHALELSMFNGQDWSPSRLMGDLEINYVILGEKSLEGKFEVVVYFYGC